MRTCDIKMAVRAYSKALQRSPAVQAQREGWLCDRHFDGGEWSDAAHSRFAQDIEERILAHVAARFEIDPEALYALWDRYNHEQTDRMLDAMFPNLRPEAPRFIDGDE